jgi:uncharacterized membrane protein
MATALDRTGAARSWTLLLYGLYLVALFTAFPMLIAAILAYWKRGLARGTVYESHFDNLIFVFWVSLVVGLLGLLLTLVLIGWAVLGLLFLWVLWRSVRGLFRALDGRPWR